MFILLSSKMPFHQNLNVPVPQTFPPDCLISSKVAFIDIWFASRHYQMEKNEEFG